MTQQNVEANEQMKTEIMDAILRRYPHLEQTLYWDSVSDAFVAEAIERSYSPDEAAQIWYSR